MHVCVFIYMHPHLLWVNTFILDVINHD